MLSKSWRATKSTQLDQVSALSLANKLGLPPGMQVNSFDVFQITPKQGAIVYESKIAPTTVNGLPNTAGGALLIASRFMEHLPLSVPAKKKHFALLQSAFSLPNLVGAIGLEPTTPTMSRYLLHFFHHWRNQLLSN
jgi:hypothetical protein